MGTPFLSLGNNGRTICAYQEQQRRRRQLCKLSFACIHGDATSVEGSVNFLPTLLRSEKLDRRAYLNHDKTGHHSASHSIWLLFCPAERKTTISGAAAAGDYGVPLSPRKIGGSSPTRSIASCKAIESDPRPPDNNDSANYESLGARWGFARGVSNICSLMRAVTMQPPSGRQTIIWSGAKDPIRTPKGRSGAL